MAKKLATLATFIALLGFALAAGFFYTYSISVMRGLDSAPAMAAIDAMRGINREVTNGWFALSFFGSPLYAAIGVVLCLFSGMKRTAIWLALAFLIYMAGTYAITVTQHLPRNDALAMIDTSKTGQDFVEIWNTYSSEWTAWNHVRAISAFLAAACAGWALRETATA